MNQINLVQGSPEWLAHRAQHFNASDAPAMLGCSPYKTRTQLLDELARGFAAEVDAGTQRLFDAGHRFEALARPLAESILGEDLYPVVGTNGSLSASFDGLTLAGDVVFEHKTLNAELRECMEGEDEGPRLPLHYRVQMEQQLLVSGASKALFMATKWDGDTLIESRHCWYSPDPALRAQILAGWEQFERDLAAHVPAAVAPVVIAQPVQALPAVAVTVSGDIAIRDNFGAFEVALRDFLENRLIREPKTDQDFADLDVQIKAMKSAEAALDSAEAQMLAQIQTVDTAKRTKDMLAKLVRDNRLMAEKLLASEKERRKAEIVNGGQAALRQHISALQARVGVAISVPADFAGVIKGKKSLASMEDAIGTELARAKIEASRIADLIDLNNGQMVKAEAGHLFPDFAQVCTKAAEDFANLITGRAQAAAQRLEAERQRIRAEEAARLEARDRLEREAAAARAQREAQAAEQQRQAEAAAAVAAQQAVQAAAAPAPAPAPIAAPSLAPAPEVRTFARAAAPAHEQFTVRLGEIQTLIAPFSITAEGLAQQGFQAHVERGLKLYRKSDVRAICLAAAKHFASKAEEQLQAA